MHASRSTLYRCCVGCSKPIAPIHQNYETDLSKKGGENPGRTAEKHKQGARHLPGENTSAGDPIIGIIFLEIEIICTNNTRKYYFLYPVSTEFLDHEEEESVTTLTIPRSATGVISYIEIYFVLCGIIVT